MPCTLAILSSRHHFAGRITNIPVFSRPQAHRCGALRRCASPPAVSRSIMSAQQVDVFIEDLNTAYEKVHKTYEDNFWATKMGLSGCSAQSLAASKNAYDAFLADPNNLQAVRSMLNTSGITDEQKKVLSIMEKTFKCYITEDPAAAALKEKLNNLEATLASSRNTMALGYGDPVTGELVKASSVQLRNLMRTSEDERVRKACYEGLCSIGISVVEAFCEIVKTRNQLGKLLGFEDFYDYKVSAAEGFNKKRLFEILDTLEEASRDTMTTARAQLAKDKGVDALQPWNMGYALAGTTEKEMDPYFPFENAVDVWARCFAALGISYKGATMNLDLCDREGKYSNGFCHWPQPAWRKGDGAWVPSVTNFTSLATPNAVGSGRTALATLLHEGGHAAHFANIDQRSPFFSQERAPTSVAYAENQSMFLDALMGDGDWLARYAHDNAGNVIPWEVVEQHIRATHPYEVFALRAMLAVPYFEKALYELPEAQVTPETILTLAATIENKIQGGPASRPLLSVPHILSDESACYYQGYVLAEMSVHQTRAYFKGKYGYITDNPAVGEELQKVYWNPGNSAAFLSLVEQLTGKPLDGSTWVEELATPVDDKVEEEHAAYERGLAAGPAIPAGHDVDLQMRVRLVDGDTVISDSHVDAGLTGACNKFKQWVHDKYFAVATA